ncbi:unnamed protein product [Symbiodinium sp. CCMP2456]|nr:unnamed protein product [Symbiodinium sp. CCMP2456]
MASSSGSAVNGAFKVGGLAELLTDEFAVYGFPRGEVVKVLEIVEGGPLEGGALIKVALGTGGIVAYPEQDSLLALEVQITSRAVPQRRTLDAASPMPDQPPGTAVEPPCAVPDPPLAQPYAPQGASSSRTDEEGPRVPQHNHKVSMTLAADPRCRQMCRMPEPLVYFLQPSRLVCLRLWTKAEMGSYATNVVDAMLAVVHKQRTPKDVHRIDRPQGECPILEQLHAEGVWRSEDYSALAWIDCPDGSSLRAVGLASRLQERTRAMHLALATTLALELLKDGNSRLAQTTRAVMREFPVLENLVKQVRWIKERADGAVPPPPTHEECYDFAKKVYSLEFHENPNLWFSVGRIGGENV